MSHYTRLNLEERLLVSGYKEEGLLQVEIARLLNRCPSTISRELRRNSNKVNYSPATAQYRSLSRCQKLSLIDQSQALEEFIVDKLRENWTPEQISGRLKCFPEPGLPYINHESLYQWLYKPEQKKKSLHKLLPQSHGRRGRRRRVNRSSIPNRVSIHDRPKEINSREEIGHWEADLMSCQRGSQHLLVLGRASRVKESCRHHRETQKNHGSSPR